MFSDKIVNCPYCETPCEADFVDVGFGLENGMQCGPYFCENCHASQIGPYDSPSILNEKEKETGWYKPGRPVNKVCNTYQGDLVSHTLAKALYRKGLLDRK